MFRKFFSKKLMFLKVSILFVSFITLYLSFQSELVGISPDSSSDSSYLNEYQQDYSQRKQVYASQIYLQLSNNENKDSLELEFELLNDSYVDIQILSSEGFLLQKFEDMPYKAGLNKWSYNYSHLSTGLFFLHIKSGRLSRYHRFMVK